MARAPSSASRSIIAGAALFVRYSLARYLRFWLIRMTYESRANTDRIVDAIERAGRGPDRCEADARRARDLRPSRAARSIGEWIRKRSASAVDSST